MAWLATTAERRGAPNALWPEVRSAIMLGMNYGPDCDPLAVLAQNDRAAISVYAQGDDYHDLIKARLKQVARWLTEHAGGDVKVFVDTAAVMEKPLAASAGLGWQGKHTNLVSRHYGSWLFLGAIFTTLDLPADTPEPELVRELPRLSRHMPNRGLPRTLSARCAALHLVSDHRAQRSDTAPTAPADGQPHLWLRRLPGGLPLEQVRGGRTRSEIGGARSLARAKPGRIGAARRCAISQRFCQDRDQAHRPRPFRAQCAHCDRQFRRCVVGARGRTIIERRLALGARRRGVGAEPAVAAGAIRTVGGAAERN